MNVATITMSREEAQEKLEQYRTGLTRRSDAEWERAAQAYEALAEGTPLLVLSEVIRNAPRDAQNRPRLAIARADQRQVLITRDGSNDIQFHTAFQWNRRGRAPLYSRISIRGIPSDRMPGGYALVPLVPPDVRSIPGNADLSRRFVLWEVEQWSDTVIGAAPDRDPYLLEQLADDLYAVVGEWDLTEVERLVMARRRED